MKIVKPIQAGLIAAVLLAAVSMSADAGYETAEIPWWKKIFNPVECTWSESMIGAC